MHDPVKFLKAKIIAKLLRNAVKPEVWKIMNLRPPHCKVVLVASFEKDLNQGASLVKLNLNYVTNVPAFLWFADSSYC